MITGRLSRLNAAGAETVLIEDFCQQYPSHSVGTIDFGPDGMLYVSAGDGASFNWADYGQDGSPVNPCGDPPGATLTPPTPRAARCARRASAAPRPRPPRSTARSCACTRTRAPPRPATRRSATPTRSAAGSSPTASATRSASPSAPARARSGPATSAGTLTRRSTARRTSRRSATTAGPATRARAGMGSYDSLNLTSCETLYSAGTRDRAVLLLQPLREGRAGRELHDRLVVDLRAGLLHRRRLPARLQGRALLQRLLAQLHLGHVPRRQRAAGPGDAPDLPGRRRRPGVPHPGPGRRALLRRPRGRDDPPHRGRQHRADGAHHRQPDLRQRAADRRLQTARARATPRASR